jgi:putative CocE/NonD family hydrolase
MRKFSQLVRLAAVAVPAIGLTAAAVPLASGATMHPAAGTRVHRAAGPGVNRTGYITIPGGVRLAYDLTLPAATGRFPVALEYNDYTSGADNGAEVAGTDAGDLLAAGFAVLGVNQPGSGCSGGVNDITDVNEWGRAGAQAVEWAARQPWSTGHVGMFGSSWTGMTQLGVASFRPKGLDAITPFHVAGDFYRDVSYPGGVYNSAWMNMYAAGLVRIDRQAAQGGISRGDKQCIKDFRAHVLANRKYSIAPNMLAHPFDDSYWQASPASVTGRIDVPVLGCQSWQDGLVSSRATELYYDAFQRAASWFIGMNGPHGICEFSQPLTMMVSFLRHYVAGVNNGWQSTPHITILHEVSEGATTPPRAAWTSTYRGWPEVMKPVTLYFHGDGSLATGPATSAGQSSFAGPAPAQSGSWATPPRPGTSVSYTTPPLAHDADFFGPASVNLWLSSTAPDTGIEVIISEVRPDGQEQYVQAGWLDLAQRKLAPAGNGPAQSSALRPYQTHTQAGYQPLTPRTPVYARAELFPFEHVFRTGSSIRITIDSATGPVQSTGEFGLSGLPAQLSDTVYASPTQRSQVVLGLIPGATAKAPLPACGSVLGEPCRPSQSPVPSGSLTVPGTR